MTFREWIVTCEPCDKKFGLWAWNTDLPLPCPACNQPTELYFEPRGKAPGIATDEIPGGVEIRHLSTSPERFYSKTDIKRRCNELGWTWADDTPKPYNVSWSGVRKDPVTSEPLKLKSETEPST